MEYTITQLLENIQFTDLVNLDKHLKKVTNPKNGRFATISDVVTEDVCKYFVIDTNIPSEEYIESIFYQWHTREDVEQFIQSCCSMRKAAIVFNPADSIWQEKKMVNFFGVLMMIMNFMDIIIKLINGKAAQHFVHSDIGKRMMK